MKKLTLGLSALAACAVTLTMSAVSVFAEVIPVYLNNSAITFAANDAQPQIINNRTYVPIRATCDALGLTIDWNSKSEVLTLNRAGIVISHKMRSKIVTINGVEQPFDTPSINRNNRILMPIRMLAESIGSTVEWDNATRSVHITSGSTVTPVKPSGNTVSKDVSVKSMNISETAIDSNSTVTLTAVANENTAKVKFINKNTGNTITETDSFQANADNTRTFSVNYTFVNDRDKDDVIIIEAQPSDGNADFVTSADKVQLGAISVKAGSDSSSSSSSSKKSSDDEESSSSSTKDKDVGNDYESKNLIDFKVNKSSVAVKDTVKVTLTAKSKVTKVKFTTGFDDTEEVISDYEEDDDENHVFTTKITMTKKGTRAINATLYVKGDGYEDDYQTVSVKVTASDDEDEDDDDDDSDGDPEIDEIELESDYVYKGMDAKLKIKTNTEVSQIIIKNENDKQVAKVSFPETKTSKEKKWEASFEINHSDKQTYTVYAYNSDDDYDKDTIKISGKNWNTDEVGVLSVEQKTSEITEGDTARFSVVCTKATKEVYIYRGSKELAYSDSGSSGSGGKRSFTVSFEVDPIDATYTAKAYGDDGESEKYDFTITGDTKDTVAVNDVSVKKKEYYDDDDIDVDVVTSTGAYRLWIEDDRGTKLSKTYKNPSNKDDDEYEWELTFTPGDEKHGSRTFTVVAEDENKRQDSYDFKLTIKAS